MALVYIYGRMILSRLFRRQSCVLIILYTLMCFFSPFLASYLVLCASTVLCCLRSHNTKLHHSLTHPPNQSTNHLPSHTPGIYLSLHNLSRYSFLHSLPTPPLTFPFTFPFTHPLPRLVSPTSSITHFLSLPTLSLTLLRLCSLPPRPHAHCTQTLLASSSEHRRPHTRTHAHLARMSSTSVLPPAVAVTLKRVAADDVSLLRTEAVDDDTLAKARYAAGVRW